MPPLNAFWSGADYGQPKTLFNFCPKADDPSSDLAALREDAIEGEQMPMLLRLERGESATEDSLTVILQLKKEISERLVK